MKSGATRMRSIPAGDVPLIHVLGWVEQVVSKPHGVMHHALHIFDVRRQLGSLIQAASAAHDACNSTQSHATRRRILFFYFTFIFLPPPLSPTPSLPMSLSLSPFFLILYHSSLLFLYPPSPVAPWFSPEMSSTRNEIRCILGILTMHLRSNLSLCSDR